MAFTPKPENTESIGRLVTASVDEQPLHQPARDPLAQDVARLVADLEHAARFLESRYVERLIEHAVTSAVRAVDSPWLTREEAATRARCSVTEIDRARKAGVLKAECRGGTPLFRKNDVDAAITGGKW